MSLLIQATIMIIVQVILLHVALENRPSPSSKGGEASQPFAGIKDGDGNARPYNFWQWRSSKPYVCQMDLKLKKAWASWLTAHTDIGSSSSTSS
jgi:hypothetical protein